MPEYLSTNLYDEDSYKQKNSTKYLSTNLYDEDSYKNPRLEAEQQKPEEEPKDSSALNAVTRAADTGIALAKGVVSIPQTVVGWADIPSGGKAGKAVEDSGIDFKGAQDYLSDLQSPAQKAANQKLSEADGFTGTVSAALDNPSTIVNATAESLPSMAVGAGMARLGLKGVGLVAEKAVDKAAPIAAGIGEGLVTSGQVAEDIRSKTDDGLLTDKQAGSAVGAGALTGVIGAAAGRLAQKLGITDIDTLIAKGGPDAVTAKAAKSGFLKSMAQSGLQEGVLEELPQSAQERMWQNWALGKPITEGVGSDSAMGMLSGGLMGMAGGGAGATTSKADKPPTGDISQDDIQAGNAFLANQAPNTPEPTQPEPVQQQPQATTPETNPVPAQKPTTSPNIDDAFGRLNELELLADQRDLTPDENTEYSNLVTHINQLDNDPQTQASPETTPEQPQTEPAESLQPTESTVQTEPNQADLTADNSAPESGSDSLGDSVQLDGKAKSLLDKIDQKINKLKTTQQGRSKPVHDQIQRKIDQYSEYRNKLLGMTAGKPILQNRDRSSVASISQMQSIAANPDYGLASGSRTLAEGTPVAIDESTIPDAQKGKTDYAIDANRKRTPVQYAVVDADQLLTSHSADGTPNAGYAHGEQGKFRVIAGNGRTAGFQSAYQRGTANQYRAELEQDLANHGIDPKQAAGMKAPVLVRLMNKSEVTQDIGDRTNTTGVSALDPVEQAKNDSNRIDFAAFEFDDNGNPTPDSVKLFVRSMPQAEQSGLIDPNGGAVTRQALDRLMSALFFKAYGSDALVRLYSQATDPEAKNVLGALADVAGDMSKLEGAGDLDIRDIVVEAAEAAVNARRRGMNLATFAANVDIAMSSDAGIVAKMFADNIRSSKRIAEKLRVAAQFALAESEKSEEDLFGTVEKASRDDVINKLRGENDNQQRGPESLAKQGRDVATGSDDERNSGAGGGEQSRSSESAQGTQASAGRQAKTSLQGQSKPNEEKGLSEAAQAAIDKFKANPQAIVNDLTAKGKIKPLYEAANVMTSSAFKALPMADKVAAYVKMVTGETIAGAKKPKGKPVETDLFVNSEEERKALEAKQAVADATRAKDEKRNGAITDGGELFQDNPVFAGQQDIVESANKSSTAKEFGPIFTEFKHDAKGAIEKLKSIQGGEAVAALHHPDVGDIDLVWGRSGTGKHDGFGLSKLVKYHPEVVDDLQNILLSMSKNEKRSSDKRIQLESKDHKAAIKLDWDGKQKTWLLTAFEKNTGTATSTDTNGIAKRGDTARSLSSAGEIVSNEVVKSKIKQPSSKFAENTLFTEDKVAAAKARMRSRLGTLNSGYDPEMLMDCMTVAGAYIESGVRKYSDYVKAMVDDFGDNIRPYLRGAYENLRHYPGLDTSGMTSAADIDNGENNAPSTDSNLESDSGNATPEIAGDEAPVSDGRQHADGNTGSTSARVKGTGHGAGNNRVNTIDPAALDRKPSNQPVHSTEQPTVSSELPPGVTNRERSGNTRNRGIQAKPGSIPAVKKLVEQRNETPATAKNVKLADADNIAATLPILNGGQKADVLFAEKRLADNKGVLFTNGTGTGKTFTALGVIKRFALQGKLNTIVVVPSVNIADQWIKAAKLFDLTMTPLENTGDNGKGIVVTTYANFGMNESLPARDWDLVVTDESHKLMQGEQGEATDALKTMRGITYHRNGFYPWFNAKYSAVVQALKAAKEEYEQAVSDKVAADVMVPIDKNYAEKQSLYDAARKQAQAEYSELKKTRDPKVVLLSATPFAYVKTVDYAEGYLFDYGLDKDGTAYNSGDNQDQFFMQHFGYRMRYNKLTKPDAKVDTGLMERQFNSMLRKTGALSFRSLDVDFDYDRKFVLTESALGSRIDEAMDWIRENDYRELSEVLKDKFDYLQRRYLLEAIKAKESVAIVKEHLALGRKVIVFHDYKKGGTVNPFIFSKRGDQQLNDQIDAFNAKFGDIINSFTALPSPIDLFRFSFGDDVMVYNGDVPSKQRIELVKQFNDDGSGKNLILVQSASAKEGVSFHDTTGKHQRVLINLGLPTQPTTAIQQEGRIYRVGQASDAIFRYLNTGTNWERWAFATTIAQRASTAENLAAGEGARALKDAFINGFQESDHYPAGHEGEGKGGKDIDKAMVSAITEFDRAKTFYFGQGKKTSRNKSAEGKDYFATPEPVGYIMAQLADARTGDSMLEPSAGHGAIARWFRDDAKKTAVEPSGELSSRLALVFDGDIKRQTFEDLSTINKYDTIVMNPPFGSGGKLAVEHLNKAGRHLNENGRIVALIPEGPAADKQFDKWFYGEEERQLKPLVKLDKLGDVYRGDTVKTSIGWAASGKVIRVESSGDILIKPDGQNHNTVIPKDRITGLEATGKRKEIYRPAEGLHLVGNISLPNVTFERAGTKVKTRIVVIDKLSDENAKNVQQQNRDYSDITDINELFDQIENLSIKPRQVKQEEEQAQSFEKRQEQTKKADAAANEAEKLAQESGVIAKNPEDVTFELQGDKIITNAPAAEVTTKKGKVLQGVFVDDQKMAKAVDNFTYRPNGRDGGWFVRLRHIQRPVENTVESPKGKYSNEYQQDLFGEELPGAGRTAAPPQRPRQARDIQSTTDLQDTGAETGRFATQTAIQSELEKHLAVDKITTPAEAAQAVLGLGTSAVERFYAIVTDKNGKPLAVAGSFKGTINAASVYPAVVASEAFRVKGAANLWFVHNHPSGTTKLSDADIAITKKLQAVFDGSGIKAHGILATTPNGGFTYQNPSDGATESGITSQGQAKTKVPVIERIIVTNEKLGEPINSPDSAKKIIPQVANGESGLVLLDNQYAPIGFVPMAPIDTYPLKNNGKSDALYRALSMSNAASAILYDANNSFDKKHYQNIGSFLKGVDISYLDVLTKNEFTGRIDSLANQGLSMSNASGGFYSQSPSENQVVVLTGSEIDKENPFESAKEYYKQNLQGTFAKSEIGDVRFSAKGWSKVKNGLKSNYQKAQVIPAIKDVIEKGIYLGRESLYKDRKDGIVAFHNFEGIVKVGGNPYVVRVAVGEDLSGNLFYDINRERGASTSLLSSVKAVANQSMTNTPVESIGEDDININIHPLEIEYKNIAGATVSEIKSWLPKRVNPLLNSGKLQVVQSHDSNAEGFYNPDVITLVADNIKSQAHLNSVLAHELVHRGLAQDKKLQTAYSKFTTDLKRRLDLAKRGIGSPTEKAAAQRVINAKTPVEQQVEEFAAYMVSEYSQSPDTVGGVIKKIISDFVGTIRAFLVRNGLDYGFIKSLTPADLAAMAGYGAKAKGSGNLSNQSDNQADIHYSITNPVEAAKAKINRLTNPESIDRMIYEFQDKYIDLKRLRERIKSLNGSINDLNDAYLGEELYHGRMAKKTKDFLSDELKPLLAGLRSANITIDEFERYLHARHAPEANAEMALRNPNQQQIEEGKQKAKDEVTALQNQLSAARANGSATKAIEKALEIARKEQSKWIGAQAFKGTEDERNSLSGMSTEEALKLIASVPAGKRVHIEQLATKIDAINAKTLDMLEKYGLMSRADLDAWRNAYKHYIPLHRDEAHPDSVSHPIGQGFSTKGDAAKQRTGSNAKVTHILGHIAMQREAAITRGEKNGVMKKLYLMARQNPIGDYWTTEIPKQSYVDNETGFVRTGVDPLYKQRPNVLMLRVAGKDTAIVFNAHNPEAMRLASALKNLDVEQLGWFAILVGKGTRWLAAVNTQYNPIFGIINLMRDTWGAAINLLTTPINGHQKAVLNHSLSILGEVVKNKGRLPKSGKWANLLNEFESIGGQTGYRELFLNPEDRSKALLKELESLDRGKISRAAHAIADWLSDYNEAMENSVRLAAYKTARDSGMSKEQSASLAKNLTVNFNRKGRKTRELGAFYAFFNAALQGSTRLYEVLSSPYGKKIIAGGIALGAMNAMLGLAVMGGDGDDDNWGKIPDFVKQRSLIIPISSKDYLSIPMPLGFNVLPNIGRIAVEAFASGGDNLGKKTAELAMVLADAFNPLGSSNDLVLMAAPTTVDPVASLLRNKDWTGKPIYKTDFSSLDPTPGFKLVKNTATPWSKSIAEAINYITGGSEYTPGAWSPTPDQFDYIIGQLTGGVGREISKAADVAGALYSGEEIAAHKIPLAGRLYGNVRGQEGQSTKFYDNLIHSNKLENEIKGRIADGKSTDDFKAKHPKAVEMATLGNHADKVINKLQQQRLSAIKNGLPKEDIKLISDRIADNMKTFNVRMNQLAIEEKAALALEK